MYCLNWNVDQMDDLPYRDEFNSVEMRSCDLLDHTSVILRLLDRTKHRRYTRCGQINRPVLSVSEQQQQRMRAIVCKTRRLELTSERNRSQRLTGNTHNVHLAGSSHESTTQSTCPCIWIRPISGEITEGRDTERMYSRTLRNAVTSELVSVSVTHIPRQSHD